MVEHVGGFCGDGNEVLSLLKIDGVIDGVRSGNGADEDEHDQAHAFLTVVRAVEETYSRAREEQQAANPKWRRLGALGSFVEGFIGN